MNAIDRDDTAQKIAEIREKHSTGHYNYNYEVRDAIQFLLDELDRAEKELELFDQRGETIERQLNIIEQLQEENRKLLEERDEARSKAEEAWKEIDSLEQLREERDKLIEGLRKLAKTNAENISEIREWKAKQNDPEVIDLDWYNYVAREILEEIGVTVE